MKFAFFALGCSVLAPSCRASQLKLRGQTAVSELVADPSWPHLHLDKFEQKVLQMAGRRGNMDDLTDMINTKLLPEITTAHDTAKSELVTLVDAFKTCTAPDFAVGTLKTLDDARTAKRDEHATCRTNEATLETAKTNCNSVLATLKGAMDAACGAQKAVEMAPSQAKLQCEPSSGMTYETWLTSNTAWFDAKLEEYQNLKQKCIDATNAHAAQEAVCNAETAKWTTARDTCSTAQSSLEAAYCSVNHELATSCTAFETCFEQAQKNYDTRVPIIKKEEERRKVNFRVLKRMACLIPLLNGGSQADIDACKAKTHDTSAFNLVYQNPPAKQTCPAAGPMPCSNDYVTAVYAGLPANAPVETCTPCQAAAGAVQPDQGIKLIRGDMAMTRAGMQPLSTNQNQVWHLKKCTGMDHTTCLGHPENWVNAGPLTSGDVVAWFSTADSRVQDCASAGCTNQPFPPPSGHWGSLFKVIKVVNGQPAATGASISMSDTVYFHGMQGYSWAPSHIINCGSSHCGGSSGHAMASSLFRIEPDSYTGAAATATSAPALQPEQGVKLVRGDKAMTRAGMQPLAANANQVWHLKKCTGTDAATCLGQNQNWQGATELKSGDVVAWFSIADNRVQDCAGNPCSNQPFPPPSGHWGSIFKIIKVDGNFNAAPVGTAISKGDSVYFHGQQGAQWAPNHILNCGTSNCGGSSNNGVGDSVFRIELDTYVQATTTVTTTTTAAASAGGVAPEQGVKLVRGDKAMTRWGMQPVSGNTNQVWRLKKCTGTDAATCLGQNQNWQGASSLQSGDVVAWFSVADNRVQDCAGNPCSNQPFPPPSGHWGSIFKIIKVDSNANPAPVGTAISKGDSVYFHGQQSSQWAPNHILNCGASNCGGSSSFAKADSIFRIELDTYVQATAAAGPALSPEQGVKLIRGSAAMTRFGMQPVSSNGNQVWRLKKCTGSDAATCLGQNQNWQGATELKSGDVVAWFSVADSRVQDCAGNPCSNQPFPPPNGHWGSIFKIIKVDGSGNAAAVGTAVSKGDTVYFHGQQHSQWAPNHILNCGGSNCGGSSSFTAAQSTFRIELDSYVQAA